MTDQELREAVLKHSIAGERAGQMPMQIPEYLRAFNLNDESAPAVSRAIAYLVDARFLAGKSIATLGRNFTLWVVSRVTKAGYDAVEPPPGQTAPKAGLTQHFSGRVGAVQVGDGNTANIHQTLGQNERLIVDALEALVLELRNRPACHAAVVLAEAASTEINSSKGITDRARSTILGLGTLVRTLGETPAAYGLLVNAAHHAQVLLGN